MFGLGLTTNETFKYGKFADAHNLHITFLLMHILIFFVDALRQVYLAMKQAHSKFQQHQQHQEQTSKDSNNGNNCNNDDVVFDKVVTTYDGASDSIKIVDANKYINTNPSATSSAVATVIDNEGAPAVGCMPTIVVPTSSLVEACQNNKENNSSKVNQMSENGINIDAKKNKKKLKVC